ncbi:MAG: hypothetical protein RBT11_09455 [Desulfobacterales bacterium]|jgi:hypothetical protein|nr:hypothetical protein [Desulfobacterales bacterium]
MLERIGKKKIFIIATVAVVLMFAIMLFVNPLIDGQDGSSVLELQLSFEKERGVEIINSWGPFGHSRFNKFIVFDYLYAAAYAFFFAVTLSLLILKHDLGGKAFYRGLVYLSLMGGGLDWIENTMEIPFVNNPPGYPGILFFLHSIVAAVKWAIVGFAALAIFLLMIKTIKVRKFRAARTSHKGS